MRDHPAPDRPVVAIVGGGFSGAALAYHLAGEIRPGDAEIVVVEPRAALGAGLAYSTDAPAHRINVPAARMSLVSADVAQFSRWLLASGSLDGDPQAVTARGDAFPQRSIFGRYVAERLSPLLRDGRMRHVRACASSIRRGGEPGGTATRFGIALCDGRQLSADIVAVATTHPLPSVPKALQPLAGSPGFLGNPYDTGALALIASDARILVVGNGLTAADVVAALDHAGHRGEIVALSRHGLRSRGHPEHPAGPFGDFASGPSPLALSLLRRVRRTIAEAAAKGLSWHAVLDAVRDQGGVIWTALPVAERRRLVRHLRALWDVHRFRIAPQVEAVLDRRAAEGRFRSIAASLQSSRPAAGGLEVTFRPRRSSLASRERFDAVVNTTGPAHRSVVAGEGPIRSLFEDGLVRLDAVGLGLDVAKDGRAIGREGRAIHDLYIAGPLARGTFGELMGLPEVTRYAEFIAQQIGSQLARRRAGAPAERQTGAVHAF